MRHWSISTKIYLVMIALYAAVTAIMVLLSNQIMPQLEAQPLTNLPFYAAANAGLVTVVYGGLGLLGLYFAKKVGIPALWDKTIPLKNRITIPAIAGGLIGTALIVGDLVFSRFNSIGLFPHPALSAAIPASIAAGIGEELLFRLFYISFWVWLVSYIILRKKFSNQVFWVFAILSGIAFALGHYPSVMFMYGYKTIASIPLALQAEIILLNGIVGVAAAYYFRKAGYLAAAIVHFSCDIVWHVAYGAILLPLILR